MKRKAKMFHAFEGNAAELRDALIAHFRVQRDKDGSIEGTDFATGMKLGERRAYHDAFVFLKGLVINNDEHEDTEEAQP